MTVGRTAKNARRLLLFLALAGCATAPAPVAPTPSAGGLSPTRPDRSAGLVGLASGFNLGAYEAIAVDRFEVADPSAQNERDRARADAMVQFLQSELIRQLTARQLFREVIDLREVTPAPSPRKTLRLEGTMTRLDPGSEALRYFVGLGTGRSTAEAFMRFVDVDSKQVMMVTLDRRVPPFDFFPADDRDQLRDLLGAMAQGLAEFLTRLAQGEAPRAQE